MNYLSSKWTSNLVKWFGVFKINWEQEYICSFQITAVVLEFGSETGSLGKLKWVGGGGDAVTPLQTALSILPKHVNSQGPLEWDNIDVKSAIK